jgi:branched-chain amino acid transport system ATP-binding protein/branched-chain amino acid transport system permease protein
MSTRKRVETVRLLRSIARGRTMIIIDHDMDSLFELVARVIVLRDRKSCSGTCRGLARAGWSVRPR